MTDEIIRVALDTPLRRTFDYLRDADSPAGMAGQRVRVPFGRREKIGFIVSIENQSEIDNAKLKRISSYIDHQPTFDPALLTLLRWAADYYHHPLGEVIATALPKLLREGAPLQERSFVWAITTAGRRALEAGEAKRAPQQRALLERLARDEAGVPEDELADWPRWRDHARSLREREWAERREREHASALPPVQPDGLATGVPEPTPDQQAALDTIIASGDTGYRAWLLQGITGSGKTEVYLRLAERQLRAGRRALILVPEIGLTPQLVGRFAKRFAGIPLAVLHSGLTDTQRLEAWRRSHDGSARLVLGTRSAVFAPIPDLGMIVVDEEHDASFKQQEGGFRYSARDLALVRAQQLDIPIVLGSATPSLESLHNVTLGRFHHLSLPRRAGNAQPPTLKLIDLRAEHVHAGLSTTAATTIEKHLADQGQVLVYINRRGYAPTLACTACGWVAPCLSCDARLTVYRHAARLRCHHCGADRELPRQCPQCGYAVKTVGQGTERIEESLAETFQGIGIARLDRDVVRRQDELEAVVSRITSGDARILVGTQMIAKGHDFPDVTLVVVLNADQGLFSTDFRAAERLAQTIVQVAGRAGRGDRRGEVLIQTEYPEHPLLRGLLEGGYEAFASAALAERESAAWPPFARLAALRASALQADWATDFLAAARRAAPKANVRLLGPAPAAMAKRAGRFHAQLLIESGERAALHRFLDRWVPAVEALPEVRRVRWALDVDPLELF
jgi:primosomal protein N' (replication factor Y)